VLVTAAVSQHRLAITAALLLASAVASASASIAFAAHHRVATGCPAGTAPHPLRERPLVRAQWLDHTVVTEYWPAPERWFAGRALAAPGLPGKHRVDWLYSARGLPMEGDGIGLDGRRYHYGGPWHLDWVNTAGEATAPCNTGFWTNGRPYWPAFGWRNAAGAVTFPLAGGGWSNGEPARELPLPTNLRFDTGPSLPLHYWRSIAVDPHLIPLGSRVFVPAFCRTPSRGWFVAADTGGTVISGHHVDVYRPPPATPDAGQMLTGQRIFVIPSTVHGRTRAPTCR
jgi:3D (Asp-Asp-Asp) domain-containing protein